MGYIHKTLTHSNVDGTIRTWNFETGQILLRVETGLPCLSLSMIKKNIFYHYTEGGIQLWNVNRYQHTFSVLYSRPILLRRLEWRGCVKLMAAVADGTSSQHTYCRIHSFYISSFRLHSRNWIPYRS
jgi:hypothetical protein